ncbi:hypothetical protein I6F41_17020 [Pseudoalteromonas sp. SCQQ13]|nr:hypothetical protein [Pseudoalteromonas sp. SCQQ13]
MHCPELVDHNTQQKAKGNSHQSAVRALAYKWVRILFRCWKTGKAYDESKYLKALKEKGSPLFLPLKEKGSPLLVVEKAC